MNFLKKLLGFGPKTNYKQLVQNGALIIDVRTPNEFKNGHIEASVNSPLNNLEAQVNHLQKNSVIITCCASGVRSGIAKKLLKKMGYTQVYNGGAWSSLEKEINK